MTNPNLSAFKFNDLLPLSVQGDPKFLAASECLDNLFTGFDERVKSTLVYSQIDELDHQQLDDLAQQWNIGYYEGYLFAESLQDKRALVKHAIMLHWHKGTIWAMKSVPQFLGMPAFLVEWFDADLLGTHMEPYEFDLAIDTGVRGASPTIQQDIRNLINAIKNVRSYLRHIILMTTWKITAYYGAQGQGVNVGTIRPLWWPGGEVEAKFSWGAGGYGAAAGHVRPYIWHKKVMPMIQAWTIGGLGFTSVRVNPKFWPGGDISIKHGRASGGYGAAAGHVTPKRWYGGSVKVGQSRALGNYSAGCTRVLPKMWMGNILTLIRNSNRMGTYAATVGRVYPKHTI